jgi:hypothetical protein
MYTIELSLLVKPAGLSLFDDKTSIVSIANYLHVGLHYCPHRSYAGTTGLHHIGDKQSRINQVDAYQDNPTKESGQENGTATKGYHVPRSFGHLENWDWSDQYCVGPELPEPIAKPLSFSKPFAFTKPKSFTVPKLFSIT